MIGLEKLNQMKNKPFLYHGKEIVVLGYCENTGEDGDQVEIYLNDGTTIEWNICDLLIKLNRFKPITNTVVVLANERLNQVSTINPAIINDLSKTILDEINLVKQDPSRVAQSKQIFQGVSVLTNLAKTEIEYRKYLDNQDKKR